MEIPYFPSDFVLIVVCISILFQHIAEIIALAKKSFTWAMTAFVIMSIVAVLYIYSIIAQYNQYLVDVASYYNPYEKDTYDSMIYWDQFFLKVVGFTIVIHFLINLPSAFLVVKNLKKRSSLQLQLSLETSN